MAERHRPLPTAFAENFRESVRIGFNWDRFFEERWPIELVMLNAHSDLARCFMPWYVGRKRDEVAYDDHDAVPMCLTDVPKAVKILNEEHQADIHQYVDSFRKQGGIIEFASPTYALPRESTLCPGRQSSPFSAHVRFRAF